MDRGTAAENGDDLKMVLILRRSDDPPDPTGFDFWASVNGISIDGLPPAKRIAGLAGQLEDAFLACRETWWKHGRELSAEPSAAFAHTPSCAGNVSDFGLMLAWSRLAENWDQSAKRYFLACDDPWLFRHLDGLPAAEYGRGPLLWPRRLKLSVRGFLGRVKVALSALLSCLTLRQHRHNTTPGQPAIIAYGHPNSRPDGYDGYFGELPQLETKLDRLLHVDCAIPRARALSQDGRAAGIAAFGNPFVALSLIGTKWRPTRGENRNWLIRRAAALEGATGMAAMIKWQIHCQTNWLHTNRPPVVLWPWENHSWERALVREARSLGFKTIGYQHSVVGGAMLNYSPNANPDRLESIPDQVLCTGALWRTHLVRWGMPQERLQVAGAWRMSTSSVPAYDPNAPIFIALPFSATISGEIIDAIRNAVANGLNRKFLIKQHPMNPFGFTTDSTMERTDVPFDQQASLSGLLFAASSVGIEAYLAGIPTIRFQPSGTVAPSLSEDIPMPVATNADLCQSLKNLRLGSPGANVEIFAPITKATWQQLISDGE